MLDVREWRRKNRSSQKKCANKDLAGRKKKI